MNMQNQSDVQDSIDSLIDVLNTQALAEDQIEDTCEHAHTNNFRRHGRAHFQRNCDFTGCHPFFSADPFVHNATPASTIVFEASIPEATYRLPYCGIVSSVDDTLSVSLRAYLCPVACFLIVISVDVVSRSCRYSRSAWRLPSSTMSVRFF